MSCTVYCKIRKGRLRSWRLCYSTPGSEWLSIRPRPSVGSVVCCVVNSSMPSAVFCLYSLFSVVGLLYLGAPTGFFPGCHSPVWARGRCRISPPRFLAECCKRQRTRLLLFCCILGCLLFLICIEFVYLYFPVRFCLSVSVKWLAVKTTSEMTYTVSSGALNSTPNSNSNFDHHLLIYWVYCWITSDTSNFDVYWTIVQNFCLVQLI